MHSHLELGGNMDCLVWFAKNQTKITEKPIRVLLCLKHIVWIYFIQKSLLLLVLTCNLSVILST